MRKFLMIDDDSELGLKLGEQFALEDFHLSLCAEGEHALDVFEQIGPDLVLLELNVPGLDGYEICRGIRKLSDVPLIVLSERGDVLDKVVALELGADDYLQKPFEVKELLARIKAVLRRYDVREKLQSKRPLPVEQTVMLPGLKIDKRLYLVVVAGKAVEMPPKELDLLYFLASNPNRVFTREQLLEDIWGYEFYGESRTVDVHIKRIREKLKRNIDKAPWSIRTVWSVGYKFEFNVEAEKAQGPLEADAELKG